jgi:hypothetical protein
LFLPLVVHQNTFVIWLWHHLFWRLFRVSFQSVGAHRDTWCACNRSCERRETTYSCWTYFPLEQCCVATCLLMVFWNNYASGCCLFVKLGLPVLVGRYYSFVPRMCKKTPLCRFLSVLVVPTNAIWQPLIL